MLLYMIRHGESTTNPLRAHAGWAQIPLTQKGEQEALIAREKLKGILFDAVYSSDLFRAVQTKTLALPDVPFLQTPLLREIHVGELSGKIPEECQRLYGNRYLVDKAHSDYRPYGGESREEHLSRVVEFLRQLEQLQVSCVAAFCHEGTLRRMLEFVQGLNAQTPRHCKNGGVCVFEFTKNVWRLVTWDD